MSRGTKLITGLLLSLLVVALTYPVILAEDEQEPREPVDLQVEYQFRNVYETFYTPLQELQAWADPTTLATTVEAIFDELGREGWIYFAKHSYENDKERKSGLGFMRYISDGKPAFTVDYKIGNGNLVDGETRKIYADKVGDRFLTATERRDLYLDCWYERINELGEEGWQVPQTETLQFLSGMGMRLVWKLEPANGVN